MISLERLQLAKRYVALIPDFPSEQSVEAVNPALAELYRETFHLREPCPDWLSEEIAIQHLDSEIIP